MADMKKYSYHENIKKKNILKLRELEALLPRFCLIFFNGMTDHVAPRTLVAYAYDLEIFFRYINENVLKPSYDDIKDIPLKALEDIQKFDIENYLQYLTYYTGADGTEHTNDERGKKRKLSSLRSFYNYYYESELIRSNPASIVHVPKIHDKNIIRLDSDETSKLIEVVENGSGQSSAHELKYHEKNAVRDVALVTLLLGTGIRVSECVGLDITDVDFDNGAVRIVRKGGNEATVYFGDEVYDALSEYMDERMKLIAAPGSENALFLSMQKKRISVRAVENLVKKYASYVTSLKKITPHKLRSTYGTALYRESGDIYLVASVLGHKDVNTTRKHYASMDDDKKRMAANMVKLKK